MIIEMEGVCAVENLDALRISGTGYISAFAILHFYLVLLG